MNLPSHCTLVPSCLSQDTTAAAVAPGPASLSHPVATPSSEQQATALEPTFFANQAAAVQNTGTVASPQNLSSSNGAVEQQDTGKQSARMTTEVLVAELDWGQDASSVAPPFDVVLVADVVSQSTSSGALLRHSLVATNSTYHCCFV